MKALLIVLSSLLLISCGQVPVERYANEKPVLDLPTYFSGPVQAWGMFQDRSGEVIKRFHVDIQSRREGDKLILDERFLYSDGTRQRRVWTLTPDGTGRWIGTADDVVGEAIGDVAGNALRWRYHLNLPVGDSTYVVYFDDWMYLMDDKVMLNRSVMSKWGFRLGEVTLTFVKR